MASNVFTHCIVLLLSSACAPILAVLLLNDFSNRLEVDVAGAFIDRSHNAIAVEPTAPGRGRHRMRHKPVQHLQGIGPAWHDVCKEPSAREVQMRRKRS